MNVLHLTGGFDRIWALMKRQPVWFVKMVFLTGLILSAPRMDAGAGIELVDGDRVAFVGGTLFDRGRLYGEIETALLSHFRGRNLTVRIWAGMGIRSLDTPVPVGVGGRFLAILPRDSKISGSM